LMDAKNNGVSFVSGDRKKEGILPNLSIYENLVVPLYRTTSKAGVYSLNGSSVLADGPYIEVIVFGN